MHPATPQQSSPHTTSNRLARFAWGIVYTLFIRPSPRFAHKYRNIIYRLMGARLAPTARIYPTARVWLPSNLTMAEHSCIGDHTDIYNVAPITIGPRSTVSHYSFLCTASHDFEDPTQPLTTAFITLGENVWLAADVFIAPGCTIPDGVVLGARSSVFTTKGDAALPAWHLCAGSPARAIRPRVLGPAQSSK